MSDRELDEMLARALARYSDIQPLDGLESRVLHRVAGAGVPKRGWLAVESVAAVSCLAILFLLSLGVHVGDQRHTAQKQRAASDVKPAPTHGFPEPARTDAFRRAARLRYEHVAVVHSLPKRNEFPGRTPMTTEEVALVRFVTQSPDDAAHMLSASSETTMPIEIPPVRVEPLQIDDQEKP